MEQFQFFLLHFTLLIMAAIYAFNFICMFILNFSLDSFGLITKFIYSCKKSSKLWFLWLYIFGIIIIKIFFVRHNINMSNIYSKKMKKKKKTNSSNQFYPIQNPVIVSQPYLGNKSRQPSNSKKIMNLFHHKIWETN